MSPEQARGEVVDHRSDLFALGAVLYEMLSGRRAFEGDSSIETANAILKEEPPGFPEEREVPPALDRIVRHCLEKKPQDRAQSARDLVFELEGLADAMGSGGSRTRPAAASHRPRRWVVPTAVALLSLAGASAAFLAGRRTAPTDTLRFQRLTFRRGPVWSARFTPDGQSIIHGAAWDGQPIRLFTTRLGSAESRPMDLPDADLLAISRDGDLALSLDRNRRNFIGWTEGMFARAPLGGGAPRPVLEHVAAADWSPDGRDLAVVRQGPEDRLEYPIGNVLHRQDPAGILCCARFSPAGDALAFVATADSQHAVHVADRSGKVVRLTPGTTRRGPNSLAWSPDGREVWFGTSFRGDEWAIYGVDLRGRLRVVAELPLAGHLYDVAPDGRALLTIQEERGEMFAALAASPVETNISWLDWSRPGSLSRDGRLVAFREMGHGGARTYPWYVRRTDGSAPAVKVVEESTWNGWVKLSPDGSRVVQCDLGDPRRLRLVPVGPGEPRTISLDGVDLASRVTPGGLHPLEDNRRVVLCGQEPGRPARSWAVDLAGGRPRPLTPEGQCVEAASPDGRVMVVRDQSRLLLYSIDGGPPRNVPGPPETGAVLAVTTDGGSAFVRETDETGGYTARIVRRDLATGRRETWKELRPSDQTGIIGMETIVSADGRTYAYSISRSLSALYLVEGLR
jgi:dipeptidyl aminopeptidase/acylaminoacyl peptidase